MLVFRIAEFAFSKTGRHNLGMIYPNSFPMESEHCSAMIVKVHWDNKRGKLRKRKSIGGLCDMRQDQMTG